MYSPKIREQHIPKLYRMAKVKKVKMTQLLDNAIREFLEREAETSEKSSHSSQ